MYASNSIIANASASDLEGGEAYSSTSLCVALQVDDASASQVGSK